MPPVFNTALGRTVKQAHILQITSAWQGDPNTGVPLNLVSVNDNTLPAARFRNQGTGGTLQTLSEDGTLTTFDILETGWTSQFRWNLVGQAYTAWLLNVTDTNSLAASYLLDLQVAGVSKFRVRKDGQVTMTGDLTVPGNLTVDGTSHLVGAATLDGALAVAGATTLSGTLHTVGAATFDSSLSAASAAISGNATVGGTLGVTGATTLSGSLHVVGAAQLDSTLTVTGATDLNGGATVNGTLHVTGAATFDSGVSSSSLNRPVVSKTANYTATTADDVILVDATSGNVTISLPLSGNSGHSWDVKKTDSSVNTVTTKGVSGNVDGAAGGNVNAVQNNSYTVVSDGTNGWVI